MITLGEPLSSNFSNWAQALARQSATTGDVVFILDANTFDLRKALGRLAAIEVNLENNIQYVGHIDGSVWRVSVDICNIPTDV
jgi:hypothetical protein